MKLLIITQTVDKADPALGFFHQWIEEFARQCEQVTVLCLKEGTHTLPHTVHVLSLGKETHPSRFRYLWLLYTYVYTRRFEYDAVFVHMNPEYVVLGAPLWRLLGKRVALWYTHKSVTLKLRLALRLAHIVFTASKESFRLASPKVRVVGHGIDTRLFTISPGTHDVFTIGSVSRITKSKQIELIIDMAAEVRKVLGRIALSIGGAPATNEDRVYEATVRVHARAQGFDPETVFLGPLTHAEVPACLATLDAFVNLSETGSLDKAILEALASGVPVVTTNVSGREVVRAVSPEVADSTDVAAALTEIAHWSREKRDTFRATAAAYVAREHSLPTLVGRILGTIHR